MNDKKEFTQVVWVIYDKQKSKYLKWYEDWSRGFSYCYYDEILVDSPLIADFYKTREEALNNDFFKQWCGITEDNINIKYELLPLKLTGILEDKNE